MTPDPRKNWISSGGFVARTFALPTRRFMHLESGAGIVLMIMAVAALLWANLPMFGDSYDHFWHAHVEITAGPLHFDESLKHIVNDGLMAIFFFVVGLEIKREIVIGELRDSKKAALPAIAALGGMIVPAAVFLVVANGVPEATAGWGIPMATDIAFSLGILALVGSRVPVGAKLFLLALAVVDDLGAIAVIAIFYTGDVSFGWLVVGVISLGAIAMATRVRVRSHLIYMPMALLAWFAFLESGVHATIAGVMIGLLTPAKPLYSNREFDSVTRSILDAYPGEHEPSQGIAEHEALLVADVARESVSPLSRATRTLHGWSSFVIIPLFALANAGVRLVGTDIGEALTNGLALGVALGLVFGKTIGITLFAYLAVRTGWGKLPRGVGWTQIVGISTLAGVGFTVALFIAELAFDDPALTSTAKIGIFAGSLIAGIAGYVILRKGSRDASPESLLPEAPAEPRVPEPAH